MDHKAKEQVLRDYEKKTGALLKRMFGILVRAQRKKDDINYKKILNTIQKNSL